VTFRHSTGVLRPAARPVSISALLSSATHWKRTRRVECFSRAEFEGVLRWAYFILNLFNLRTKSVGLNRKLIHTHTYTHLSSNDTWWI